MVQAGFEPAHGSFRAVPDSESGASAVGLLNRPLSLGARVSLHRAGLEPTPIRLKGGGSAVELPVRTVHMHREGFEPPADPLEEGCSDPLSYRCEISCTVSFSFPSRHVSFHAPGRTRTCIHPVKSRRLRH
jgi:hypothetical protein